MPILSLNDTTVRSLKPTAGQITYWDKGLKSFGIRVNPGGTMTWLLLVGQERQRIKLGNFPTITLKEARSLAKQKLAEITLGQHRKREKTFGEAYATYEEIYVPTLKTSTAYEIKRLIRKHFLPRLRHKHLAELDPADITDITDRLSKGTAWHAHAAVGAFLNWCAPRYIKVSPLIGVTRPSKSASRERVLTDAELKAVWIAAERSGTFGSIVKLLMLTGQRRNEIASLRTSWIQENQITLPKEITKNSREHRFPHSDLVGSILSSKMGRDGVSFLFPARGRTDAPFNGWSKGKVALDKLSGVTNWTLHDLRRTYATNLQKLGVKLEVIEALLNHVSGTRAGVIGIYQRHTFFDEMKEAVANWEERLKILAL